MKVVSETIVYLHMRRTKLPLFNLAREKIFGLIQLIGSTRPDLTEDLNLIQVDPN